MKTVVVTGSTRGIGLGLAREFLRRGCQVVISGRSAESVSTALRTLAQEADPVRVFGQPCEVTDAAQGQALWEASLERFGRIDYWINNAGIDIVNDPLWKVPPAEIARIVHTNLLSVMLLSQIVVQGMKAQGGGQLFNMEGFGSDGRMGPGMTSYGTTKYGLRYFTRSLARELKDSPVIVGTVSPGMVITDLLLQDMRRRSPEEAARIRRVFNILADPVEPVTAFLAERVLSNTRRNPEIAWLTNAKIALRFLTAPFRQRDLFATRAV